MGDCRGPKKAWGNCLLLLHGYRLPPAAPIAASPYLMGKPTLLTDQGSLKLLLTAWAQTQSHRSCQAVPPQVTCPQGDMDEHLETPTPGHGRGQLDPILGIT